EVPGPEPHHPAARAVRLDHDCHTGGIGRPQRPLEAGPEARIRPVAPITFAHRGARLLHPENTLPAFRAGLEEGAAGPESDRRLGADGKVVRTHDAGVRGPLFGLWKLRVHESSAARLARHGVPRLADLYAALGCDYELSVDLKDDTVGAPIV